MAEYVVNTPERSYNGKAYGVKFDNGSAILNDVTVPKHLGRDVDEVAVLMERDFSYDVRASGEKKAFSVPELPWKEVKSTMGHALGAWSEAKTGDQLVHDDYGPVIVSKVNQKSVRLKAENGEEMVERDISLLTKLNE
ncbi:MAG: hypothetical protein QF704_01660 [Anaerolineales bacterium]|jgi:hypothetical protein|nr:hypothetical protein [Anaerolineales bacterium]